MTTLYRQKCLDGKTLIIGPGLINDEVKTAIEQIAQSQFANADDLIYLALSVEEIDWLQLTDNDRNVVMSIAANVYSALIDDADEFIDLISKECYEIALDKDTYIPLGIDLRGLDHTFVKADV